MMQTVQRLDVRPDEDFKSSTVLDLTFGGFAVPNRTALPSYRHHKARNQAVVTLSGRDFYLGPYGTRLSRDNYDRVVGEWLAAGRTLPAQARGDAVTVIELVNAFRKAAELTPDQLEEYAATFKLVGRLYGRTPAIEFGPLALKAVRQQMIAAGWTRKTINTRFYQVRRIFRWGVEHEMFPGSVSQALDAVAGLRAGKSGAVESEPIEPVAVDHVEACIPFMPKVIQAMVRVQLYTGMRGGEVIQMRTADIDTTGEVWVYRPQQHKSKHRGKLREVAIGVKAQAVLQPYLRPDLAAYLFSPAESEAIRRAEATARRKTPASCGNRAGAKFTRKPKRPPGDCYDVPAYRRAVYRAADAAFPPPPHLARRRGENDVQHRRRLGAKLTAELEAWRARHRWHPHQLRHTFATEVRRTFGLEHTQRALGHSNANVTQIYAGVALEKAIEVARAIG
jgi:integrase